MVKRLEKGIGYDFYAELSVDQGKRYIAELEKQRAGEQFSTLLRCVTVSLYFSELERLEQSRPNYLALPAAIRMIEQEKEYLHWCAAGRLWYRLAQFEMNKETLEVERITTRYSRAELLEEISAMISLADPLLAATTPLVCRVGYCVGWLSGLSSSQPDDAQAVIVMLGALVAPLLVAPAGSSRPVKQVKRKSGKRK